MDARGVSRREVLGAMGLATVLAAVPQLAAAQTTGTAAPGIQWNAAAFNAPTVAEVLKALGAGTPAPTAEVSWGATPEIAENGAVVPVNVTSKIPGTDAIAILIEKNPNKLAANFYFPDGTAPAHWPVLPPWGTSAVPVSAQMRTAAATCAVESGRSTASGVARTRPRQSAAYGAMSAGSESTAAGPSACRKRSSSASCGTDDATPPGMALSRAGSAYSRGWRCRTTAR